MEPPPIRTPNFSGVILNLNILSPIYNTFLNSNIGILFIDTESKKSFL